MVLICNKVIFLSLSTPQSEDEKVKNLITEGSRDFLKAVSAFFAAASYAEALSFDESLKDAEAAVSLLDSAIGKYEEALSIVRRIKISQKAVEIVKGVDYDQLKRFAEAEGVSLGDDMWETVTKHTRAGDPISPITLFTSLMRFARQSLLEYIESVKSKKPEVAIAKSMWRAMSIIDKAIRLGALIAYINLETMGMKP